VSKVSLLDAKRVFRKSIARSGGKKTGSKSTEEKDLQIAVEREHGRGETAKWVK